MGRLFAIALCLVIAADANEFFAPSKATISRTTMPTTAPPAPPKPASDPTKNGPSALPLLALASGVLALMALGAGALLYLLWRRKYTGTYYCEPKAEKLNWTRRIWKSIISRKSTAETNSTPVVLVSYRQSPFDRTFEGADSLSSNSAAGGSVAMAQSPPI